MRHDRRRSPRGRTRLLTAVAAAAALFTATALGGAATAATPHAASLQVVDDCGGQCYDILPPGANGSQTLAQILLFKAFGVYPPNSDDELAPYSNLVSSYTGLTSAQISSFYNSSALGVQTKNIRRIETPETGATIVWDQSGTPDSRELVSRFAGSPYFTLLRHVDNERDVNRAIDSGEASALRRPSGSKKRPPRPTSSFS